MTRERYNTNTKNIIYNKIIEQRNNFTAKEIKEKLEKENQSIGISTIYRYLNELETLGIIKKYYNDNNTAQYQYLKKCNETNHFFLKCNKCGATKHIDCDCISTFSNHIKMTHGFNISNNNLFITGLCNKCQIKEE